LKLNGAHQVLVYADDVNTLGRSICTIEKKTQALVNLMFIGPCIIVVAEE